MNRQSLGGAVLATLALAGCNFAPRYVAPAPPVPDQFRGAQAAGTAPAVMAWKDFYADPRLRQVLDLASANSRDLKLAVLDVERGMAAYRIQRAALLPSLAATAGETRQRLPANESPTFQQITYSNYSAGVGVSAWELDFFGRIRNLKQAAFDQYLGLDQARRAALASLRANVAEAYLELAADREALRLTQETLDSQDATLDLTSRRFQAGFGTELDQHRARMSVEAARVDLATYQRLVALDQSALDLVVGRTVPEDLLPRDLSGITPFREDLPCGLPAQVLVNRPDVLEAEYQLRAATANIGAARAAYFPTVSLSTSVGTLDTATSGLFKNASSTWSFVPQASLSIFDFGATRARVRTSKVDRDAALARYEKAIQAGYKEVSDALVARSTLRDQMKAQQAFTASAGAAFKLATARYEAGADSSLGVLDAQRTDLASRQALVALRRSELANLVTLYKALGGGAD